MRVGLVVTGGLDRSGRERIIPAMLAFVERLAARHEVHAFVLHHEARPSTYALGGATIHDLGRVPGPPGLRSWRQSRRLIRAIRAAGGVDVLHGYWGLPGAVAVTAGRALHVPVIVTADSGEWVSIPEIRYGLQRRWVDRRRVAAAMAGAARVTVCTHFMQDLAIRHGVRAEIIPIGVPRAAAPPAAITAGPPWRLIHVASINPVKDHAMLLRAVAGIIRVEPDTTLDVVGADTMSGDMPMLAESLGISRHVVFHGFLPSSAIDALWSRAQVHIVSSRHEAAGVVVLEAAMAGVPTAGTRVGYVADFAPDRAVAVNAGDAAGLAAEVVALLRDPARRASIASAARAWALAHDADWTRDQFDRLYREVASA